MRVKDAKNGEGVSLWIGIEITNFVQNEQKKANKKKVNICLKGHQSKR